MMCAGKLLSLIKKCLNRDRRKSSNGKGGLDKSVTDRKTCKAQRNSKNNIHCSSSWNIGSSGNVSEVTLNPVCSHCSVSRHLLCNYCSEIAVKGTTYSMSFCVPLPPLSTCTCDCRQLGCCSLPSTTSPCSDHFTNINSSAFRFPPPFGDPVQHVVYVPQSSRNGHSHQPCSTSSHDDVDTTNLPPQIPISLDGEEGYQNSQRLLQTSSVSHEVVNPPPNRTVFQGESPPPYRAHSVGQLDKSRINRSRAGRDCKSSPCVPYSHPTNSSAGGAMNHSGSSSTYSSSHSNRDSSSNYTPSHGVATNGHLYNNNHHHKDGNSSHITFFSGGTPVVVERKSYHQVAPTLSTSNPRSVRIFSDPSSSSSALVVGHQLRTVSCSTSSNSSTGPGNQGPPPTYCDLSDTEVFDVLTRPSPSEAS